MSVGRNDPCPCGSGKKHKKCCLDKTPSPDYVPAQEAETVLEEPHVAETTRSASPVPTPSKPEPQPSDPRIEAMNERWKEFERSGYDRRVELFQKTLEEPDMMDEEMAFYMLDALFQQSAKRGDRARFDALVDALRERLPEVYRHDAHWYVKWTITNALADGRFDAAHALACEMAELAGKNIDVFNQALDQLAYYGRTRTLVASMNRAWPHVKGSKDIIPFGISEFAERAANYILYDYLERTEHPSSDDAALIGELDRYIHHVDQKHLARAIEQLTGASERRWTMKDFDRKALEQSLSDLSYEFLGYLRRQQDVPFPKGDLARRFIGDYILDREAGRLVEQPSMLEAVVYHKKPKALPPPEHKLCPDRGALRIYLGDLLYFVNPQHYKAAAVFQLIPAWLRFLESRGLVDADRRARVEEDIRPLGLELARMWRDAADPALARVAW